VSDGGVLWQRVCSPPDRRPIWEWAEEHVRAIPYSPNPGPFHIENSPQIREPLEAIADPRVRNVCILAAVQAGKTTTGELALCHIIANAPGPALWLNETDEDAKDQSETRLQRLFDHCAPVRALYPANRHQKRHGTIIFSNGMSLWITGAHNRTNLQRRSIRYVFADECWQYPPGHMAEAEARVTAFGWLGKCVWMSQGGDEGDDFHRKFETTDRREWSYMCPECGGRQAFKWECVEWSKDARGEDGEWDFGRVHETASLRCERCNAHFPDSDETRRRLNASGAFVATNPKAARANLGFQWNALATMSWGALAEMYLRAKRSARMGDVSPLKQFWTKRLALPWREFEEDFKLEIAPSGYRLGESWDREGGIDRRGEIVPPPLPEGEKIIPLRFLSVDVQMDHTWFVIRSWAADGSSRLIDCGRATGWEDIDELQRKHGIHSSLVFVDANYASFEVYRHCAGRGWTALIGDQRSTFIHRRRDGKAIHRVYAPRHKVVVGRGQSCSLHRFSATSVHDCLARLRRNQDPSRGPTWEVPEDVPELYLQHMESQRRVKRGEKWIWEKIGDRADHMKDCEGLQVCAALMLKIVGSEAAQAGDDPGEARDGDAGAKS